MLWQIFLVKIRQANQQRVLIRIPGDKSGQIGKRTSVKTLEESFCLPYVFYNLKFIFEMWFGLPLNFYGVERVL
jgi:hypothetical protein